MGKLPPPHMIELENQSAPEIAPPKHWVSAHPYTATLAAAAFLVILGTTIVVQHSAANPPTPGITAWGGDINAILDPNATVAGSVTAQSDILRQVQDNPPYSYTMPDLKGETAPPPPVQNTDDSFSYEKFMAGIGQPKQGVAPQSGTIDITYAFPPTTLFNVPTPTTDRTPVQQLLYNYGNEVGSYIESYEQQHSDQTQVLKNHIEDQSNPEKIKAVTRIGNDLAAVGTSLLGMEDVPTQVSAAHKKLAESYRTVGKNLTLVAQAHGNDALLSSINTYNASVDVFAKDFVALVSFFSTYGVTFGQQDAGSVFTFTYSGGM